jgi:AcrR family transcriptional regulator
MPATVATDVSSAISRKILNRQNRTRERILAESARQFLEKGFENASVENIVEAAEIARSSFYRFFSNRDEVLASISRPVFERGLAEMTRIATRPPRRIMPGLFDMYLTLWHAGPDALRVATRMSGRYFRLFEDVHQGFRKSLTTLVRRVEATGLLLNGSGDNSARLIARTAVPILEVYRDDARIETLFHQTMSGLLMKPEARP